MIDFGFRIEARDLSKKKNGEFQLVGSISFKPKYF